MSEQVTRVGLVDDHTLVRDGLVALVNSLPGYEVVLTAEDGLAFTTALSRGRKVDIAIVDLSMPIMDGYATIRWLHDHCPDIRSVALTFDDRESAAIRAIRNGACGFLLKNMSLVEFKEALDQVRDHGRFEGQGPAVDRPLRTAYERAQDKIFQAITERELDLIRLACAVEEYTYEEIAKRLGVKLSTLETHRKNLFERFGIKSRSGLVIFAYRWGIVEVVME